MHKHERDPMSGRLTKCPIRCEESHTLAQEYHRSPGGKY
jgi:hypothetical protein